MTQPKPWPRLPIDREHFENPPREYGILPFWFLNGELDPEEMRYQLREFRAKGMPGIILHGRFGLEMDYIGEKFLDRIQLAVEEAEKLGLTTWIYDEMNWPSGTADKRVLKVNPDLAQRYIECLNFTVRGPWFTYLTGADSRYLDFERSIPVAAFAVSLDSASDGEARRVIDLTPNLSFRDVIPWEAPAGNWRLMYIVEKTADYYIDAMDPQSTREFLRLGYDPYAQKVGQKFTGQMPGFYTDEPAMHYYITGGDNPIVPWTRDMFRRFHKRNGYNLRPRLPDLFFDISPDSARVRFDFYNTLTDFYSHAFYQQIQEWCRDHDVLFTGHLLYEEGLRRMIRVEGNLFRHYEFMDVIGVDHLYPIIGSQDRPDEHVAMKVASSAAHQLGSPRLLCESFGGIFMDATMQRMKWVSDWQYVLGVNLINPHGFHYTLEGPRKRDWPPSMFYQFPWWRYYGDFSHYISRLSHLLSGGKHVAPVAVLWPINAMFATYTPQSHNAVGDRIESDFNTLTDLLMRLHYEFDYLDEDILSRAEIQNGAIRVNDEEYRLLVLPPMMHIKLSTLERLEQFVAQGGKVLGMIFLPSQAFAPGEKQGTVVDIAGRMQALFGIDPQESQKIYRQQRQIELVGKEHARGGKAVFIRSYALSRQLPMRLQEQLNQTGQTESPYWVIETKDDQSRYYFAQPGKERQEITQEVLEERRVVAGKLLEAMQGLLEPDIILDNQDVFCLHRINDGQDIYFLINSTRSAQSVQVSLPGEIQPVAWDPSTGFEQVIFPAQYHEGRTHFRVLLPPIGSTFILPKPAGAIRITDTNLTIDSVEEQQGEIRISAYGPVKEGLIEFELQGSRQRREKQAGEPVQPVILDGEWDFKAENANALVLGKWLSAAEEPGIDRITYIAKSTDTAAWLPMVPGAWSYQLPAEPETPYPIAVWIRASFLMDYLPPEVNLIIDGFAASEWQIYINEQAVSSTPVRSAIDSQMKAVAITPWLQKGENLAAIRLVLNSSTDGLLDLLKITGDFSLAPQGDGSFRIAAPCESMQPASWTAQGYPFYSGTAVYRKTFELPASFKGQRIFLESDAAEDALEALVNGQLAGVRLWAPYGMEITGLLQEGQNTLELRVANTLVNLLEATARPSGLAGAPRLVPSRPFIFVIS